MNEFHSPSPGDARHDLDDFQALDVLRAGAVDLELPEVTELAERLRIDEALQSRRAAIQSSDERMRQALFSVTPSAGLAERLTESLMAASLVAAGHEVSTEPKAPASRERRLSRRGWLVAAVATSAAIAAAFLLRKPDEPITATNWIEAAIASFVDEATWTDPRPLVEAPRHLHWQGAFLDPKVLGPAWQIGWRPLGDGLLGHDAVVYELRTVNNPQVKAALFVVRANGLNLPNLPLSAPSYPVTQGVCATVWEADGLVYILIVPGDVEAYRNIVPPLPPVAVMRSNATRLQFAINSIKQDGIGTTLGRAGRG